MYEETLMLGKVHGKLFTLLCLRTSSTPLGNSFEIWCGMEGATEETKPTF